MGTVNLTSQNLNNIIFSEKWGWISDILSKKLLGTAKLKKLEINDNIIELKVSGKPKQDLSTKEFEIEASCGSLLIKEKNKHEFYLLPMDPNVKIETALNTPLAFKRPKVVI